MKFSAKLCELSYLLSDTFLDLLFPKAELVREIEAMSTEAFADGVAPDYSSRRFRGHYPPECADWCRAILAYRNRHVRAAIWELKYRKNARVARLFSELLGVELNRVSEQNRQNGSPITIVPIPLSEKRRRERGYNQIELILEQLHIDSRWKIDFDLLRRNRHTIPQTTLTREERLKNLEDCFEIASQQKIAGARYIIIDDVMTTGSTLRQARATLLQTGASEVIAITLAH